MRSQTLTRVQLRETREVWREREYRKRRKTQLYREESETERTERGRARGRTQREGMLTEGASCVHTRACSNLPSAVGDIWRFQYSEAGRSDL